MVYKLLGHGVVDEILETHEWSVWVEELFHEEATSGNHQWVLQPDI